MLTLVKAVVEFGLIICSAAVQRITSLTVGTEALDNTTAVVTLRMQEWPVLVQLVRNCIKLAILQ